MFFQRIEAAGAGGTTPAAKETYKASDIGEQAEELSRDLFSWFRADSLEILIGVAVGLAIYSLLVLIRGWVRSRLKHHSAPGSWSWVLLKVISRTRSFFLVMVAVKMVVAGFGAPDALARLVTFVFTITTAIQGAFWVRELLLSLVERRAKEQGESDASINSAIGVLTVIINVVVWAITGIILLDNLGVNVTGLVAGLGIGGIAIGLAAQGIFSDLFAALSILLDKPFQKGETIQVGGPQGVVGTVEHIGLKTTRLRALSGEIVVMANTNLLSQQINNFAAFNRRRVVMVLGFIYQTSPEQMAAIPDEIRKIVESRPLCTFDRCYFTGFGAYSLDYELVFFVEAAGMVEMLEERQAISFAMFRRFAELGIEFAYPTQVQMLAGPDGEVVDPHKPLAPSALGMCEKPSEG
ncbi:mechanosensitive ion channel family protein [Sandaracinobacteroides sp. A072]|uniref:mechanosensitive ion channel family protein n=1 Tax=Sandaracinobacteroides sp. A072 TaxID=3461146 RepID=UPI004041AB34